MEKIPLFLYMLDLSDTCCLDGFTIQNYECLWFGKKLDICLNI